MRRSIFDADVFSAILLVTGTLMLLAALGLGLAAIFVDGPSEGNLGGASALFGGLWAVFWISGGLMRV